MLDEAFADSDSLIHRLDPRLKVILAAAFSILAAVADRFPALTFALILSSGLVTLARLPARALFHRLLLVNGFVALLWLMLPFSFPGETLVRIGPLTATREGLRYALLITLKTNAIILAGIALLSTTHLTDIGRALGSLHVPDKITHILLFMLRYLGVLDREYVHLSHSMAARCFRPRTNLHTYKSYAHMVGMLLLSSYERAEAVYAAMLCRGFAGKFHSVGEFSMRGADYAFGAAAAAALLVMATLQWDSLLF